MSTENLEILRSEIRRLWKTATMQTIVHTHLNFEYVQYLEDQVIALKTAETGQHAPYIRSYGILYGNKSYKQKIIGLKELFHQNVLHSLAKASD